MKISGDQPRFDHIVQDEHQKFADILAQQGSDQQKVGDISSKFASYVSEIRESKVNPKAGKLTEAHLGEIVKNAAPDIAKSGAPLAQQAQQISGIVDALQGLSLDTQMPMLQTIADAYVDPSTRADLSSNLRTLITAAHEAAGTPIHPDTEAGLHSLIAMLGQRVERP